MSEKSCKLCDLYGICGAHTAGCVKDPDEGCPFYRYFKKVFQPRWIPVSEKLPEINEEAYSNDVLLSLRKTAWDVDKCQMVHITTIGYYDENAISSDGAYLDTEGWELENKTLPLSDVIAWMPLPTDYSEVEDGNDD